MDFYLTDPSGASLHFPLNPERVTATTAARIQNYDSIQLGEFALPRGSTPVRFYWDGIFPGETRKDTFLVKSWRDPKAIAGDLSGWRDTGTKLKLLVTETPINHDVYIQSFEHTWYGGHGDVQYSIELVQARDIIILDDATALGNDSSGSSRPVPAPPKTYVVKAGDNLWAIAKKNLHSGARADEIYALNKDVIGPDKNLIRPGQVLRLPG